MPSPPTNRTILETKDLTKSFGSVSVLTGVSLRLNAGKILGLVGENGAGKSTFAKCISGQYRHNAGTILLNGTCYTIPQEFTLIPTLRVYENIFLGRELSRIGILRKTAMRSRAKELLSLLKSTVNPDRYVSELSVAEKQMVEIAKAFLQDSNLLIMDEPTTVLNREETEVLFTVMRDFTERGGSIVYVSHKLDEVREICDEIAVLRDGILVEQASADSLTSMQIAQRMVGRELSRIFPPKLPVPPEAEVVLRATALSSGHAVRGVSFELRKGEILGLAGLGGSGRTELAETLCGLRKRTGGTLDIYGKKAQYRTPAGAVKAGMSYLSEDRQGTAILPDFDLAWNATLSSLPSYCRAGFVQKAKTRTATASYVKQFQVKASSLSSPLCRLSGGNQQKIAIAKGLDTKPRIFIFDEPTRGVDIAARTQIYTFIRELAETGVACLLISSDLEEILGNCSRVLVMRAGELAGEVRDARVTANDIMYLATGVQS